MRSRYLTGFGTAALLLTVLIIWLAGPTLAAPPSQEPILPTPTLFPVENVTYELEHVGGQPETLTFTYPDQDGFTFGQASVTSLYPRGIVFTLNPQSANGTITDVTLLIEYISGYATRVIGTWDAAQGLWIAHAWPMGEGHPAWVHFTFRWRVINSSGAAVETDAYPADYTDITRVWYKLTTPYMIVYWYGLSDDDPDRFAYRVTEELAATHPRRIAGFGRAISYLPIGIIYGTRAEMGEMTTSGLVSRGGAYYLIGMSAVPVPEINAQYQEPWLSFATDPRTESPVPERYCGRAGRPGVVGRGTGAVVFAARGVIRSAGAQPGDAARPPDSDGRTAALHRNGRWACRPGV